jgi:INO80 complex subunit C
MVKKRVVSDGEDIESSSNSSHQGYCFLPEHSKKFKNPKYSSLIGSKKKWKNLKNIQSSIEADPTPVDQPNFLNIEAAPSLLPKRKYCDLTGLQARYTCPKTGLRYYSAEIYAHLRHLGPSQVQQLLSLRNAHTVLK